MGVWGGLQCRGQTPVGSSVEQLSHVDEDAPAAWEECVQRGGRRPASSSSSSSPAGGLARRARLLPRDALPAVPPPLSTPPQGIVYGKPVSQGITQLKPTRNLAALAEERVGRKCGGLRVLNSYWVNQDAVYKYFEVILVDPAHAVIRNDARINWICNPVHKHREMHGLTSAGRKFRGLVGKGHLHTKLRPSRRAVWKKNNRKSLRRYR